MEKKYTRYGIDWQNEVMKNPKMMIVQMLRRVAMERDELYAAQHHACLTPESLASSQAVVNASALEQSDSVPPPRPSAGNAKVSRFVR